MSAAVLSHNNAVTNFEIVQASLFFIGLIAMFIIGVIVVLTNSPPIIVGTEMNTNGLVEYLCLGKGCENLQNMDW